MRWAVCCLLLSASACDTSVLIFHDLTDSEVELRCPEGELDTLDALGAGTPEAPYLLCSSAQLSDLAARSEAWSRSFVLGRDLTMPETPMLPIGNAAAPFSGRFDGAGHTVTNL